MLSRTITSSSRLGAFSKNSSWCVRKFSRSVHANNASVSGSGSSEPGSSPDNEGSGTDASSAQGSKGGFAKAIAKLEGHENFPKTIKFSPLVQMGDPQGKIVQGTIVHVVDDDLYIDFGAKFNCVCPRPQKNGSTYAVGKKVRLMVHDLELSTRFLGAKTDLTILEADCSLLGLARSER